MHDSGLIQQQIHNNIWTNRISRFDEEQNTKKAKKVTIYWLSTATVDDFFFFYAPGWTYRDNYIWFRRIVLPTLTQEIVYITLLIEKGNCTLQMYLEHSGLFFGQCNCSVCFNSLLDQLFFLFNFCRQSSIFFVFQDLASFEQLRWAPHLISNLYCLCWFLGWHGKLPFFHILA